MSHQVRRERLRRRRRKLWIRRTICVVILFVGCFCLGMLFTSVIHLIARLFTTAESGKSAEQAVFSTQESIRDRSPMVQGIPEQVYGEHPVWTEDFLTLNEYSRPGSEIEKVKNIFVHYTANKGTSAAQNRSYFEQLKDTHERCASAHFIIGYEGEIIQCIPLDEQAYALKTRNNDSISIECCYLSDDGSFTQETYDSLLLLLGWLMKSYDLEPEDILRHYDCGGKKCPVYYVKHEDAWDRLRKEAGEL